MKKNIWIKIAAVVLAVALWFYVVSRGYADVSVEASIKYENVPEGLQVVSSETMSSVSLGLRGHERIVKNLLADGVVVTLDLEGLTKGSHQVDIEKGDIKLPVFVRVVSMHPSAVTVTLGEVSEKSVPVRPGVVGEPKTGYRVVRMKVMPGSVGVEGAGPEIDKLKWLETEPVDISGAAETITREVKIAGREGIRPERESVTVEIVIEKGR